MSEKKLAPILTISGKRNRLRISKDVLRLLGMPSYICLYKSENYESIAIGACQAAHVMSFKVPEVIREGGKADCEITSSQFIDDLARVNGLERDGTYRMKGEYAEAQGIVTFRVSGAFERGKISPETNTYFEKMADEIRSYLSEREDGEVGLVISMPKTQLSDSSQKRIEQLNLLLAERDIPVISIGEQIAFPWFSCQKDGSATQNDIQFVCKIWQELCSDEVK